VLIVKHSEAAGVQVACDVALHVGPTPMVACRRPRRASLQPEDAERILWRITYPRLHPQEQLLECRTEARARRKELPPAALIHVLKGAAAHTCLDAGQLKHARDKHTIVCACARVQEGRHHNLSSRPKGGGRDTHLQREAATAVPDGVEEAAGNGIFCDIGAESDCSMPLNDSVDSSSGLRCVCGVAVASPVVKFVRGGEGGEHLEQLLVRRAERFDQRVLVM
jgi:hypothetical protein